MRALSGTCALGALLGAISFSLPAWAQKIPQWRGDEDRSWPVIWEVAFPQHSGEGTCYRINPKSGVRHSELITTCQAMFRTRAQWFPDNREQSGEGKCFTVDTETGGRNFKAETNFSACESKFKTRLQWFVTHPKHSGEGACFRVDEETGGRKYKRKVEPGRLGDPCATLFKVENRFLNGNCYLVDAETGGWNYKRRDDNGCLTAQVAAPPADAGSYSSASE
jgi:hypothetical protein